MKPALHKLLLAALIMASGCDQPTHLPVGSVNTDFIEWMKTMTKIKVTYSGMTNLHSYLKQGVIDPGTTTDYWYPREMEFSNWDSSYTISWQDSVFETRSCFVFRQIDPPFTLSSDCGTTTMIRGIYHSSSRTVSDIYCMFRSYHASDQNNYQEQDATMILPAIDIESVGDDSLSFSLKNWNPGSLRIDYNYDEEAYTTYIRQMHLAGFDSSAADYPNSCRVVLSMK